MLARIFSVASRISLSLEVVLVLRGWHISVVIWSLLQLHKLSLPLKLYVHERLHRVIILSGPLIRNRDVVVSEILAWLCNLG